jgi:uncharacterized coiled-coil protein SlyX
MNRPTPFRTAPVLAPNLISRSPLRRGFLFVSLALACFALLQIAMAVSPPPDGGYPINNTAEGTNALFSVTTGASNTAIGLEALYYNTTGSYNTAVGATALNRNTTGNDNTANGLNALFYNTAGSDNTAQGVNALVNNTTADNNTATGAGALFSNTTGSANTANGVNALYSNNADNNTAIGYQALLNNTTGNASTATGVNALFSNTTGTLNTANGVVALLSNTTGSYNTATGDRALEFNTTASYNTAYGVSALQSNTTGTQNTANGYQALITNTTGNSNIAVGFNAGQNLTTGSNNIDIGANVVGNASDANTIRIGKQGTQKSAFVAGIFGTAMTGSPVVINSNGKLGVSGTSSIRFKEAVKPMDKASDGILALKPVTFRYKEEIDPDGIAQFGLVAEEVEKVNPDLITRDENGKPTTVRYEAVNAMLLNEFLKEHRKVQELEMSAGQQQKHFESALAKQEATIEKQQQQIEALTATVQKVSDQVALSKPAPQLVANP